MDNVIRTAKNSFGNVTNSALKGNLKKCEKLGLINAKYIECVFNG